MLESFDAQRAKRMALRGMDSSGRLRGESRFGLENWRALLLRSGVDFSEWRISRRPHLFDVYDGMMLSRLSRRDTSLRSFRAFAPLHHFQSFTATRSSVRVEGIEILGVLSVPVFETPITLSRLSPCSCIQGYIHGNKERSGRRFF